MKAFIRNSFDKLNRRLKYRSQFFEFLRASANSARFRVDWRDRRPFIDEASETTSFDRHYILHPAWAARIVKKINPTVHTDFGSAIYFSTIISAFVKTNFYDIRPIGIILSNFKSDRVDLTKLNPQLTALDSVSCMHVLEHIGLGRYGDPIDPDGDLKAIAELKRVVKPGGSLLIVVPTAAYPRIEFNAHRVYGHDDMPNLFSPEFEMLEYTLIPDKASDGDLIINPSAEIKGAQNYGCGCYWFRKKE